MKKTNSILLLTTLLSISILSGCNSPSHNSSSSSSSSSSESSTSISTSSSSSSSSTSSSSTSVSSTTSSSSSSSSSSSQTTGEGDYYASISDSLKDDELKQALYKIIKGHTKYSYDDSENAMKQTDRNWILSPDPNDSNPKMYLLYKVDNENDPRDWNTYHGGGGITDFNKASWNKEHIWAKSNGFNTKSLPAYSDLHHLRASCKINNNARSNYPFGNVSSGKDIVDIGGDKSGKLSSGSNIVYEPQDKDKGDVARALFYMATRYYNGDGANTSLSLTDGKDSSNGKWGYLSTLLEWHLADIPDAFEINRNNIIYSSYQHNRNPYIDHPEYACKVFGNISTNTKKVCGLS